MNGSGISKTGLIKVEWKKKERKSITKHHFHIVNGSSIVSILLSLFLFYSHHALFIITFDSDDIVKEQVTAVIEQKRT